MAIFRSSVGYVKIAHQNGRVTQLEIINGEAEECGKGDRVAEAIFGQVVEYLSGERKIFDLEVDLSGCTAFQQRVYIELQKIPYGESRSYKQIAQSIGRPNSARAVGGACNRNPIHLIVPCHRVVGSGGSLTGYAAGVETKRGLLELENVI